MVVITYSVSFSDFDYYRMVWKVINKGSPGGASTFGSDDIDKISKLFRGDADVDTVDINSTFGIRHGKGRITNSAGSNPIVLNSAATASRTQTFPDETGTILTSATANVVKNDQNNNLGDFYLDFGDIAVPSNPSAGTVRLFYNTATGELSVRKSGGTTVSLESGGSGSWDPNAAETLTNKTIAFANNTLTNVASINTAQTISAIKTFSANPVISSITNGSGTLAINSSGTMTLQNATDTVVGRATTDTLTGKTIAFGSNTLTDVASTNTAQTLTLKTINAADNTVSGFQVNPRIKRQGGWYGGAVNQGQGFIAGGLPTNTGQGTAVIDATGKYQPWTSGAVAGNNAGQKSSASANYLIARVLNCRLIAKFKLTTADTNTRCFVGLSSISSTTFPAGDSQLDGVHGIGLAFRTSDTVWQIAHNDGTAGSTVYTAVTGNPARGTNIHTLEIFATESTPKFTVILDGGTPQDITTRIPGSTTGMSTCLMVETATTEARTINTWWWHVETDL